MQLHSFNMASYGMAQLHVHSFHLLVEMYFVKE